MKSRYLIKILVTVAVVGGGLSYLIFSSFNDASIVYYKTVDEVLAERVNFEGKSVRINGLLVKDSIQQKLGTDQFKFQLSKNGQKLDVTYSGILPDTMEPGRELVVQGVLQPGKNLLEASEIMTKCPSKYEEAAKMKGGL